MTLRTGKGGRYRYYTWSIKAHQGETGCKGRSIPMDKLDTLVVDHLEKRLLQPERLEQVLATVFDRRQDRSDRRREHIAELNKRAAETDLRLKRLYDVIESGVADLDDPALGPHHQPQGDSLSGENRRRPRAGSAGEFRSEVRLAANGPQVRANGQRADAPRRRRLSPQSPAGAGPTGRGRRKRSAHHGIKGGFAQNPCRRIRRKIAHTWRAQFCSEVAEREGFEPTLPFG